MTKPLQSRHYYNICQQDSNGILWTIANNYTQEQVVDVESIDFASESAWGL